MKGVSMIRMKTTVILGAGFSFVAGLPLTNDLFETLPLNGSPEINRLLKNQCPLSRMVLRL
jgi:hypothetical protein